MNSTSPDPGEEKREISAGIIAVRDSEEEKRKYLLLQHANGKHWSFPKGHIEQGEVPKEAAVRELREETSLAVREFVPDFKRETSYEYDRAGRTISKKVIFFLGILFDEGRVKLSPEHLDFNWLSYNDARSRLTYENDRKLLDRAQQRLEELEQQP